MAGIGRHTSPFCASCNLVYSREERDLACDVQSGCIKCAQDVGMKGEVEARDSAAPRERGFRSSTKIFVPDTTSLDKIMPVMLD